MKNKFSLNQFSAQDSDLMVRNVLRWNSVIHEIGNQKSVCHKPWLCRKIQLLMNMLNMLFKESFLYFEIYSGNLLQCTQVKEW